MPSFEESALRLPDGYSAYSRYWPFLNPRGAVLYHHGIQSHCGWYETSPRRLCEAGFAVLQVDRRGSGRNGVERGHAASAEQLIDDAVAAGRDLLRRTGLPAYHVVGVSWGGKLAVCAYVTEPQPVLSLSLVTPGLFPRMAVSGAEKARIGFAMLYEPEQLFDIPLNDAELLTANPRWKSFIECDSLTLRQCTAAFYLASRRMDKIVARLPAAQPIPIHLLLAGDERIVDNEATVDFVRGLDWPGGRISLYDGARHSLEYEYDPEGYFRDLVTFIQSC